MTSMMLEPDAVISCCGIARQIRHARRFESVIRLVEIFRDDNPRTFITDFKSWM
jgi:hypothetical protein